MRQAQWLAVLGLAGLVALAPAAPAQQRPYIGFAYPAGGQQGTTLQIRLGGQALDDVHSVFVSGTGVTARIVEYHRRLNNQEQELLNAQLKELKRAKKETTATMQPMMMADTMMMTSDVETGKTSTVPAQTELIARLEKRVSEFVQTPACASIATLLFVEVTIAPEAPPGEREIRTVTLRGVSNPLVFSVGQVPEYSRKPMRTATIQVLGKEGQSLRKRPPEEVEDRLNLPCTVNGQIASGEVNRYRFTARKGQRLVLTTQARQLIPYIADAVPGWFQPVLVLYDATGKEVAYDDDYRFKPDPVILYEVPNTGDYVVAIYDAIYRGREDFVYRITIGELPFITSIFPLGGRAGEPVTIKMKGWNLETAELLSPGKDATSGVYQIAAQQAGFLSNRLPFALDTLPETFETEPNNDLAHAQKVELPSIINGRIAKPDDWDVFQFSGQSNDTIVAEVAARRLDSPLDSVLKLTDAQGRLLAFNDDHEDFAAGLNTHHADSYFMAKLPAAGTYYLHIGDTARHGGDEYTYRLRLSAPRPDFALRAVPSSAAIRAKGTITQTIHVLRQDEFAWPIKLGLKNPPAGFSALPITLTGTQTLARLTIKSDLTATTEPVTLTIEGRARIDDREITRDAAPAEDRMQAFLWRHLVPAQALQVIVFDPSYQPPPKRVPPPRPPGLIATSTTVAAASTTNATSALKAKFTKSQIAGRLRQLAILYGDGLLTDEFYNEKVAECEAAQ